MPLHNYELIIHKLMGSAASFTSNACREKYRALAGSEIIQPIEWQASQSCGLSKVVPNMAQ